MGRTVPVEPKTIFKTLNAIDMSNHIKILQKQKYIAWSDAWMEVKKAFPSTYYEVAENTDGNPFFVSSMGIFVKVTVTINEFSQSINHFVMNGANKAQKEEAYSYKVKEYVGGKPTGKFIDKWVEPATSFDINTAIMRGLTKCLALHGLALYVYRDEAMPEPSLIDSHQIQQLADLAKVKNMSLSSIAKAWNIDGIAKLQEASFDTMLDWLKGQ